jgi:hypothetical protein
MPYATGRYRVVVGGNFMRPSVTSRTHELSDLCLSDKSAINNIDIMLPVRMVMWS